MNCRTNPHSGNSSESEHEHLGEESVHQLSQPNCNLANQIISVNKYVSNIFTEHSIFLCAIGKYKMQEKCNSYF